MHVRCAVSIAHLLPGDSGGTVFVPMMRSQDYPVLRLTLFFFGAAKDVPEAAKMVTAEEPALISCAS